jgi:hypothetical protein
MSAFISHSEQASLLADTGVRLVQMRPANPMTITDALVQAAMASVLDSGVYLYSCNGHYVAKILNSPYVGDQLKFTAEELMSYVSIALQVGL